MLRQLKFLTQMAERLNDDKTHKEVLNEIETVRKSLTDPKNMVLYMATNVDKLAGQIPDIYAPWEVLLPGKNQTSKSKCAAFKLDSFFFRFR